MDNQPNNPLHGVTLAKILDHLVEKYGWEELGTKININCFNTNPSVKSSLGFLRKTPWAREKVERLYLRSIGKRQPPKDVAPRAHMEPLGDLDVDRRDDDYVAPQDDVKRPEVEKPIEDSSPKESPWEAAKRVRESRG